MELAPKDRFALERRIREALSKVRLTEQGGIDFDSTLDLVGISGALPDEIRTSTEQIVGDNPIWTYVYHSLDARVTVHGEPGRRFSDIPGCDNLEALAKDLTGGFLGLPNHYTVLTRFFLFVPENASTVFENGFSLDAQTTLIPGAKLLESDFPLPAPTSFAEGLARRVSGHDGWPPRVLFIKTELDGYIAPWSRGPTRERYEAALRSIAGLGLAIRLFGTEKSVWAQGKDFAYSFYPRAGSEPIIFELPHDVARITRNIAWADETTDGGNPERLRLGLLLLRAAHEPTDDCQRIRKAAQWYFDSLCSHSELLAFTQAMVAVEILVGDRATSDIVKISRLLANRCAYLLARSARERADILDRFKRIYDTRSNIIHAGHDTFGPEQRRELRYLHDLVRRLIDKELRLTIGDRLGAA